MSENQLNRLKAGRELDALIAEKVMGFEGVAWAHCKYNPECPGIDVCLRQTSPRTESTYYAGEHPIYVAHCVCDVCDDGDEKIGQHTVFCYEPVPFFSTEIAAAWQVVDKLCDEFENIRIVHIHNAGAWFCKFCDEHGDEVCVAYSVTSIREAICLAALKAIEHG